MYKVNCCLIVFTLLFPSAGSPDPSRIDGRGLKLKQFYLSLDVEHLWQNGQRVNWETGQKNSPDSMISLPTHCSAFAAAACKKLSVYILRPPEHKQKLLANAQYDWLSTKEAFHDGWREIADEYRYERAQGYANSGHVVVAVYKNPNPEKSGHIALVMPAEMSVEEVANSGPMIIMAGVINHNSISLRHGFNRGWPEDVIRFYYNKSRPSL